MTKNPIEHDLAHGPVVEPGVLAEAVLDSAHDAILALDPDGAIRLWNRGCTELFGYEPHEVLGRSVEVLLPQERRGEMARVVRALAGVGEPAAIETERLHKSGHVLPVACRLSPLVDSQGRVVGASAVIRDNGREIRLREQAKRARRLAEARFGQSVVPQASLDRDGRVVAVNPALCRLSGHTEAELLGRAASEFVRSPEGDVPTERLVSLSTGGAADSRHVRLLRHADGHEIQTRVSIFAVRDDDTGEVLRLETIIEDVSAAAAAERELHLRESRWQSLATHSADVALLCDAQHTVLFVTAAVTPRFGYRRDELVGQDVRSLLHPEDADGLSTGWQATQAADVGTSDTFEVRLRHADGTWRWVDLTLTNHVADPAVEAMVLNVADVSERKAAELLLEQFAGLDTLTGLSTRAPLMAALEAAFAADRAASTAIALVDVTRLKLVNATHGHRCGDAVLREVAARLLRVVDDRGVVARVGGDRFAVMLSGVSDVGELFEAVGQLQAVVEAPIELDARTVDITVAIGGALGPAADSGALLGSAESALLCAKEGLAGPLHVVRAESSSAAVVRARLIEDLRRGIEENELVVHFQPVVSLPEGRPVAAEALVRWQHPDKGLLGPSAFIDAAEESGLIVDLGSRVLTEAARAAARWAAHGTHDAPFHVAVNLSARQLIRSDVVELVRDVLAANGTHPAGLMLEVTESAVMSDVDAARRTLQGLRELGVSIAVDDFGTGYSSLTYLKQFPVTSVKIDRSFVAGLGHNNDDAAICSSVINLARAMDLDCIAEGVETEQQRVVLQALGCGLAQGFLWSPAVDASSFEEWLTAAAGAARAARPLTTAQSQPDVVDAAVVARAVEMSSRGASLHTIAAALNAERRFTAQGKRWTARSVAARLAGGEGG